METNKADLSYIAESLRSLAVPIEELHEDPANARVDHAVDRIAASLKAYGQRKPLVVNRAQGNKIEAGNGTYQAAKRLKWMHIACVFVEDDPMTAAAFGIADNRVGELSKWDPDALADLTGSLEDMFTGFTEKELRDLIGERADKLLVDPGALLDQAEELRTKWNVQPGNVWQLGDHLIYCGDSTDQAAVKNALGGQGLAALTFTSPPYWVGKDYETQKSIEEIEAFIQSIALTIHQMTRADESRIVINTGTGFTTSFDKRKKRQVLLLIDKWANEFFKLGWNLRHVRHWLKEGQLQSTAAKTDLIDQHCEFIESFENDNGAPLSYDRFDEQDVQVLETFYNRDGENRGQERTGQKWALRSYWDDIKGTASANHHVAAFPLELPMRHLLLYSRRGEPVFEPFGGSGTTLIACEMLARKCLMVELGPGYVAVTLERWATMTGGTPVKIVSTETEPQP